MTIPKKRQRRKEGDLLRIPIDQTWHTYARVLRTPLLAFYDARTDGDLKPEEIIRRPILFKLWVMHRATTSGRWRRVAHVPLEPELLEEPTFFKQDPLKPNKFSLYRGTDEIPATRGQCEGLERAAVWEPENVEERLRDHYLAKPNKWVKSLELKASIN